LYIKLKFDPRSLLLKLSRWISIVVILNSALLLRARTKPQHLSIGWHKYKFLQISVLFLGQLFCLTINQWSLGYNCLGYINNIIIHTWKDYYNTMHKKSILTKHCKCSISSSLYRDSLPVSLHTLNCSITIVDYCSDYSTCFACSKIEDFTILKLAIEDMRKDCIHISLVFASNCITVC